MHKRNIIREPKLLTRSEFVTTVFRVGGFSENNFSADTLIMSVQLGDRWTQKAEKYSVELAHATLIISSKLNDDWYYSTVTATEKTQNGYTRVLEWNLLSVVQPPAHNFIRFLDWWSHFYLEPNYFRPLDSSFEYIAYKICLNPELLKSNPFTLLLAFKMLLRRSRLRWISEHRLLKFKCLLEIVDRDFEISTSDFCRTYCFDRPSEPQKNDLDESPVITVNQKNDFLNIN